MPGCKQQLHKIVKIVQKRQCEKWFTISQDYKMLNFSNNYQVIKTLFIFDTKLFVNVYQTTFPP